MDLPTSRVGQKRSKMIIFKKNFFPFFASQNYDWGIAFKENFRGGVAFKYHHPTPPDPHLSLLPLLNFNNSDALDKHSTQLRLDLQDVVDFDSDLGAAVEEAPSEYLPLVRVQVLKFSTFRFVSRERASERSFSSSSRLSHFLLLLLPHPPPQKNHTRTVARGRRRGLRPAQDRPRPDRGGGPRRQRRAAGAAAAARRPGHAALLDLVRAGHAARPRRGARLAPRHGPGDRDRGLEAQAQGDAHRAAVQGLPQHPRGAHRARVGRGSRAAVLRRRGRRGRRR